MSVCRKWGFWGANGFYTARLMVALVLTNTIVIKIETQDVQIHVRLLETVYVH
jgi:hypothetical protein